MANDFSTDESCKALWRFESGAFTTDSIGTNTLTNDGADEATGEGQYKEGSCAADFEFGNTDCMYRSDANLSAGFPFKNGDSVKKISLAFWVKWESIPADNTRYVISKYHTVGKRSFAIVTLADLTCNFYNGYNNGDSYEVKEIFTPSTGRFYHMGISLDGIAKTLNVRLWDDIAESANSFALNLDNQTNVEDADFVLGDRGQRDGTYCFDGILDEVAVFNRCLTDDEFDAIRTETYAGWKPDEMCSTSIVDAAAWGGSANHNRSFLVF